MKILKDLKTKLQFVCSLSIVILVGILSCNAQIIDTLHLQTATGQLEGTYLYPEDKDSFPLVMIIAGSGPTDRNGNNPAMKNNAYQMLADSLITYGIASFRYDKRGLGGSSDAFVQEKQLRFHTFVDDAIAWIELLDSMSTQQQMILLGHSEGSLLGILAAQEADVDQLISVAGAGSPIYEILRQQLQDQPPKFTEMALPILDSLVAGHRVDSVSPLLYSLFRPDIQPYLLSWFQYDPATELQKLEIPILILQGTTDIQVNTREAEKLAAAHSKAKLKIIEGMSHIMKTAPAERFKNIQTYNNPDLPLHPELVKAVVQFIQSNTQ